MVLTLESVKPRQSKYWCYNMVHVECVHFKSSKAKHESCDQNYRAGKVKGDTHPTGLRMKYGCLKRKHCYHMFYHSLKDCFLLALLVWQQLPSSWQIQIHKSFHFLVLAPQRCLIVDAQSAVLQLMSRQMPLHVWIVSSCTGACHLHSDSSCWGRWRWCW